ncbi:tetratricopeptide repeat protein [Zymobacter palmae]|uniref:tetratricopeptide repeat protein n=1 Tax=Zymobacter palmae TaxID=33074 RepID=UPI000E764588|nr:SEL1-like repeat protein [Zymobacter palmae]
MRYQKHTYILALLSLFVYNISNARILYAEPDKSRLQFSSELFSIKCPTSNTEKEIYLCALKTMTSSPEAKEHAKDSLIYLAKNNIDDAKYSLFITREITKIPNKEAVRYLLESAQDGLAVSQLKLGELFLDGELLEKDEKKSFLWIKNAAENKNYKAMKYLSKYYFSGTGIERNDSLGFHWLSKLYGDYGPLFDDWDLLGAVYETGRGTPVDLIKAYMCYDLEGTAGIEEKARIAPKMTAEQRAEGLRLSHEWQEKNHVYTMQSLGLSRQKDGSYR